MINPTDRSSYKPNLLPNEASDGTAERTQKFVADQGQNLFPPTESDKKALPPFKVLKAGSIQEKQNIEEALDDWIAAGAENELASRATAKLNISSFLENPDAKNLSLEALNLSTLPDIWNSPTFSERLEILNLSHNALQTIPDIDGLTNLRSLNLSHNSLENLQNKFPRARLGFVKLKEIDLSNNRLTELPNSIEQLTWLGLENMNLSNNQITSLSNFRPYGMVNDIIYRMNSLKTLNLSGNQINSISRWHVPISLQKLDLSHNLFEEFPINEICNVRVLDISHNRINEVSGNIGINPGPFAINLSHNSLERMPSFLDIQKLPHKECLNNLRQLDISSNLIPADDAILSLLPKKLPHLTIIT